MPIPQAITDAIFLLQDDADQLGVAKADAVTKRQLAVDATHAADLADNAVASDADKLKADKASLIQLIDSTFPTV